jgi:hypothetical protein
MALQGNTGLCLSGFERVDLCVCVCVCVCVFSFFPPCSRAVIGGYDGLDDWISEVLYFSLDT